MLPLDDSLATVMRTNGRIGDDATIFRLVSGTKGRYVSESSPFAF
jgi:hypothetical protein